MSVHLVNMLFMGAMAIGAAVLAAVLAVAFDGWWSDRKWRKDLEDAEKNAPLSVELIREDEEGGA